MFQVILPFLSWKFAPTAFLVLFIGSIYLRRWQTRRAALALGSLAPDVGVRGILGETDVKS
jgi:hypothetical protein